MGLSADEVAAVDAFIDQLKSKSGLPFQFPTLGQQQNKMNDTKIKVRFIDSLFLCTLVFIRGSSLVPLVSAIIPPIMR